MHDPRVLLDPATEAERRLARRGYDLDLERLEKLLSQRNAAVRAGSEARAASKRTAEAIRTAGRRGTDTSELVERAKALKVEIREIEKRERESSAELRDFLLWIPSLPEDRCPDGDSEESAAEIRRWGTPPAFDGDPLDHVDLGERLGILDLPRASRLSGSRFVLLKGPGAALERSIAAFFLALHTGRHGLHRVLGSVARHPGERHRRRPAAGVRGGSVQDLCRRSRAVPDPDR